MVYITQNGRMLPDTIRFDPDEARRVVPQKLVDRGLVVDLKEGRRAVELLISTAEEEKTGTPEENK